MLHKTILDIVLLRSTSLFPGDMSRKKSTMAYFVMGLFARTSRYLAILVASVTSVSFAMMLISAPVARHSQPTSITVPIL